MTLGVMLSYCHPGTIRGEFMSAVIELLRTPGPISRVADMRAGPQASMARNTQARYFVETGEEWLWIVDTDTIPGPDVLAKLLAAADPEERPVISGVYLVQTNPASPEGQPCIYMGGRDDKDHFWFVFADPLPDGVHQVAATGCGCLLIHRSVFRRLSEHKPEDDGIWFANLTFDGREFGEDMSFCLRLSVAGIPLYVHTGAKVGHVKTSVLWP